KLVSEAGLDAGEDFRSRLDRLFTRIPRRREPINEELRLSGGFTGDEVLALREIQARIAASRSV
ncbi:MAG: hypothetical protein ACXVA9_11805, partial [Bdellovibrionales bacterium]